MASLLVRLGVIDANHPAALRCLQPEMRNWRGLGGRLRCRLGRVGSSAYAERRLSGALSNRHPFALEALLGSQPGISEIQALLSHNPAVREVHAPVISVKRRACVLTS